MGSQWFCDNKTKALVIISAMMGGEGVQNCSKSPTVIYGRRLCTKRRNKLNIIDSLKNTFTEQILLWVSELQSLILTKHQKTWFALKARKKNFFGNPHENTEEEKHISFLSQMCQSFQGLKDENWNNKPILFRLLTPTSSRRVRGSNPGHL